MKTQVILNSTFANSRTLEITTWIFGIIFLVFLFVSANATTLTPYFEDEAYINDIPFNTEMVVNEMMLPEFDFEEEAYVDDIPFATEMVVAAYNYRLAVNSEFDLSEENYVDDIPFNTCLIATTMIDGRNTEVYACTK